MEASLWDGRPIEDPEGTWSFTCRSILSRKTGLHAFARILMPISTDPAAIYHAASSIADNVDFTSGHGGLTFTYDASREADAFDLIYAKTRRYWGPDIEDMNDTLPLMKKSIKGVGWVTMLGRAFEGASSLEGNLAAPAVRDDVRLDLRKRGFVLVAGSKPIAGDQNRREPLDPYIAIAQAFEPAIVTRHPDFPGERFIEEGNTLGWIRRFVDPDGWH